MQYNMDKADEMVLALMWIVMHSDGDVVRAWKGFDWDILDRLHEKGFIPDPKSKAKSVVLSPFLVQGIIAGTRRSISFV
jgi:hypothetical protein